MSRNRNKKEKFRAQQRRQAAARRTFPDPRLWTVRVTELRGKPVTEDTYIFPVDRLRLPDQRVLGFHTPSVPGFFLMTAKALRDQGEKERERALSTIKPPREMKEYVDVNVTEETLALDALGRLASAVILSAAAVEAFANEAVDRLPDGEAVERRRGRETETVAKADMVRRLSLEEKLDLVLPKVAGVASIKGREPWPRFKRLIEFRGEVVHYKKRGQTDDPDIPSALGRLLTGEGSMCVEDAAAVILAYDPTYLPEATRQALGFDVEVA